LANGFDQTIKPTMVLALVWEASMPARNQTACNSHARFMQAVNEELTKFEWSERKLRKKDREERAKRLQTLVEKYDTVGATVGKTFKSSSQI
jgi:hypothetical protein